MGLPCYSLTSAVAPRISTDLDGRARLDRRGPRRRHAPSTPRRRCARSRPPRGWRSARARPRACRRARRCRCGSAAACGGAIGRSAARPTASAARRRRRCPRRGRRARRSPATSAATSAPTPNGARKKLVVSSSPTPNAQAAMIQRTGALMLRAYRAGARTPCSAEQRAREVVGVERPQVLQLLADPDQLDRHPAAPARSRARCRPWPCRRASSARSRRRPRSRGTAAPGAGRSGPVVASIVRSVS